MPRTAATLIFALMAAGCGNAAPSLDPLVQACLEEAHPGSQLDAVSFKTTEQPVSDALATEGVTWQALLAVHYKERRSADRDWDDWVVEMVARTVSGKTALSDGSTTFDPTRICATD